MGRVGEMVLTRGLALRSVEECRRGDVVVAVVVESRLAGMDTEMVRGSSTDSVRRGLVMVHDMGLEMRHERMHLTMLREGMGLEKELCRMGLEMVLSRSIAVPVVLASANGICHMLALVFHTLAELEIDLSTLVFHLAKATHVLASTPHSLLVALE